MAVFTYTFYPKVSVTTQSVNVAAPAGTANLNVIFSQQKTNCKSHPVD